LRYFVASLRRISGYDLETD